MYSMSIYADVIAGAPADVDVAAWSPSALTISLAVIPSSAWPGTEHFNARASLELPEGERRAAARRDQCRLALLVDEEVVCHGARVLHRERYLRAGVGMELPWANEELTPPR